MTRNFCSAFWGLLLVAVAMTASGQNLSAADEPAEQRQAASAAADPLDWPNWRGPEQNGISRETGLPDRWDYEGASNTLWKNEEAGGISSPIVLRGKLYTIVRSDPGTTREGEKVICVNAATGKKIWENHFNVFLSDVPAERIGWSCCVGDPATGRIYALGVCGYFQCLDGETGKTIWSRSLSEEFGLLSTYGGRTNVPVIFEETVIISAVIIGWGEMAKPTHRFMAFDKRTGEMRWFNGTKVLPKDTTYSTPALTVLGGQAAMVFGSGDGGVWALQPRTGKPIWNYQLSMKGLNVSPVVADGRIYTAHSEENADNPTTMGAVVALDGTRSGDITKTGRLWSAPGMVGKSSPVLIDGRLYAFDEGAKLYVLDAKTGAAIGKPLRMIGSIMHSSPVYADGKIYACSRSAWHVIKPTASGVKFLDRVRLKPEDEVLGSPIVSHGRIYVPTTGALYCIGNKDSQPHATPRPAPPKETPLADGDKPATVQVVPSELLVEPGQRQTFSVRLFNARGQLLRTQPAHFEVTGKGEISGSGAYTAPDTDVHQAAYVTARVGALSGRARIRIVPRLPWKFDFSAGEVPVTWIGARYRHIPLDFELLERLEAKQHRAAQLYIFLTTGFTNNETRTLKFDDRLPMAPWTSMLRYLSDPSTGRGLDERVTSLEVARAELDKPLEVLKQEQVVTSWKWGSATAGDNQYITLVVERGPRKMGPSAVICKITTIPLGTRSQAWMGHSDQHDYTIQADFRGASNHGKLPDMGLIAQRYTLDLMGASQQLQIRSWASVPSRFSRVVPYAWNANTWYTLKFSASTEGGKAVLRGKVWPSGETEPSTWTVEATDAVPNLQGSPGLFGNATNAEILIDDISVKANERTESVSLRR